MNQKDVVCCLSRGHLKGNPASTIELPRASPSGDPLKGNPRGYSELPRATREPEMANTDRKALEQRPNITLPNQKWQH